MIKWKTEKAKEKQLLFTKLVDCYVKTNFEPLQGHELRDKVMHPQPDVGCDLHRSDPDSDFEPPFPSTNVIVL